jgi:integrase
MFRGTIVKRCSCRDETGTRLGSWCPRLRRPDGGWAAGHGRWGYQLELPVPAGTPRRQLRRAGFPSREAAAAHLHRAETLLGLAGDDHDAAVEIATLLKQVKWGRPLPDPELVARRVSAGLTGTTTTLGGYLDDWLAARGGLAANTRRTYGIHITRYLKPHLGHIPVERLRIAHIQAMFTAITDHNTTIQTARRSDDPVVRMGVAGMRTVGPATMHRIRATLRKALNDAIRDRLIEFNPAAHVELPAGRPPKARVWTTQAVKHWQATGQRPSPVMVWTLAQAGQFLDYAQQHDPDLYPMFALIAHRGLRRGEAVGLPDANVDLDTATIVIDQQITTCGHSPITTPVKSDAGDRLICLDTGTQAALTTFRQRRTHWQTDAANRWPNSRLYFQRRDGRPWHPDTITKRFTKLAAAAGLPPVRLHDLRHGAATYLKAAGGDLKDIQHLLGHSSLTITSDTYTTVITELDTAQAAANLIPRHHT